VKQVAAFNLSLATQTRRCRDASVDADLRASGRAEPLAARYLLGCIIGLDGIGRLFNIEQVISRK
jgi:hypothetical protein